MADLGLLNSIILLHLNALVLKYHTFSVMLIEPRLLLVSNRSRWTVFTVYCCCLEVSVGTIGVKYFDA